MSGLTAPLHSEEISPSRSRSAPNLASKPGRHSHPPSTVDGATVVNSWTLLFHPALVEQLQRLIEAADRDLAKQDSKGGRRSGTAATSNQKVLSYLYDSMLKEIPQDPTAARYRQGNTLGAARRHWCRDKFGAGRFRLFFRYLTELKCIIYGWVNDQDSLRTYGSSTDAYRRFGEQLDAGHPPDDWDALQAEAKAKANTERVSHALTQAKRRVE